MKTPLNSKRLLFGLCFHLFPRAAGAVWLGAWCLAVVHPARASLYPEPTTLLLQPEDASVLAHQSLTLTASGGVPPYVFSMVTNLSGSTLQPLDGTHCLYTAGPEAEVFDVAQVTDASSSNVAVSILVAAPTGTSNQFPLPKLDLITSLGGDSVTLQWPVTPETFLWESTPSLDSPAWTAGAEAPDLVEDSWALSFARGEEQRFFRLRRGTEPAIQSLGPTRFSGRIRALVVRPDQTNTIWAAAASGGLWVSRNGGNTWTNADDFLPTLTFSSLILDRHNPDVMYAGSGEIFMFLHLLPKVASLAQLDGMTQRSPRRGNGIFKTTDGGASWRQLPFTANNTNFQYVNRIAIHPKDTNIVLAATATGLWRSPDGGVSWQPLERMTNMIVLDVRFHPVTSIGFTNAVAGTYAQGAFFSRDGNALSWFPSALPPALTADLGNTRIELAPDPGVAGEWMAAYIKSGGPNDGIILLRSRLEGSSFEFLNGQTAPLTLDGATTRLANNRLYTGALWVDPRNHSLIVGAVTLCRGVDNNTRFVPLGSGIHNDYHAIVEHPSIHLNRTVYLANDGGVSRIDAYNTTSPVSFNLNTNLVVQQFNGAMKNPLSGVVVGGGQDTGTLRRSSNGVWTELIGGTAGSDGMMVATDPASTSFWYYGKSIARVYRSTDGGANATLRQCFAGAASNPTNALLDMFRDGEDCTPTSPPGCNPGDIGCTNLALSDAIGPTPILIDPVNPNVLYVGARRLWRTRQAKADPADVEWRIIKPASPIGRQLITTMAIAASDPNVMCVGTLTVNAAGDVVLNNRELWMTTQLQTLPDNEDGSRWTRISDGSNLPLRPIARVAIHPANPARIYVALSGWASDIASSNLWKGTRQSSGSFVWQDISAGLPPGPVFATIAHPTVNGWIYAGTEAGLYRSTDDGQTWSATTVGLARVPISELSWVDAQGVTPAAADNHRLLVATYGRGVFELDETPNPEKVFPEAVRYPAGSFPTTGSRLSRGHVENLLVSDDRALVSTPQFVTGTGIAMELSGRTGFSRDRLTTLRSSLRLEIESSATRFTGFIRPRLTIELFNFTTGAYEQVFSDNAPLTDQMITVSASSVRNFISDARELKARLTWGSVTSSRIDFARWVITR